jgi:hypothetical protein
VGRSSRHDGRRGRTVAREYQSSHENRPSEIKERLQVDIENTQRARVAPEAMELRRLAGEALRGIILREDCGVFGHHLIKVLAGFVGRGKTEERLEEWLLVFEIQELREERKGLWVWQCKWYDWDLESRVRSIWARGGRGQHRQVGAVK